MARPKPKPTIEVLSATDIAAELSLPGPARQHADYARESFTERDIDGGEMTGVRMFKMPCRVFADIVRPNPNRKGEPALDKVDQSACLLYQGDCDTALGATFSHEISDFVDNTPSHDVTFNMDCSNRVSRIKRRMQPNMHKVLRECLVTGRDKRLSEIYPDGKGFTSGSRAERRKRFIDAVKWIAVDYGLKSGDA